MAEQGLQRAKIRAAFQQMRRERVAEDVRADAIGRDPRVGGDVATRGRMATDTGTAPVPASHSCQCRTDASPPMEQAIAALAPANMSEDDIEMLVQTITDQIMATAG